jgi:diguanylate cyclase (GGDEF)-like protein
MLRGGDDFLTKPVYPDHLLTVITSRAQRSRALRASMVRDSLTGLLNHTTTKEHLVREVALSQRRQSPISFAMIDLDRFKSINDTYGHATGDRVIKSLSRVLRQRLRKTDIIGRYGGEEFAIMMPDTDARLAAHVLEQIRAGFAQIRQRAEEREFAVTFSCGVASAPPYNDPDWLNHMADQALYRAKALGRNRVVLIEEV